MSTPPKCILLTLGEELLLGLTPNSHLTYIGDQLRQGGILLHACLTLSDDAEDIADHFRHFWSQADLLITTGGLGPTVDDRTREIIAATLGETLVFDIEILSGIERRFAQRAAVMSDNNRKQAYRFKNGLVLENPNGTAPGLWLDKDGKTLIMLPGPPNELRPMFQNQVAPRLRKRRWLQSRETYLQLRTIGVGESALETLLLPLFEGQEGLETAYCAHQGHVDCRLSYPGDPDSYDKLIQLAGQCREMLGDDFLCCGDARPAKVVADILVRRTLSLAIAESCTGGSLSNEFTDIAGASNFFLGGLITYSSESKADLLGIPEDLIHQHTVVSAEVAIAMATGVAERLESDYALSVTGYAGPEGGTDSNPIGTVFVGLHSPRGTWAKRYVFSGDRANVKRRTVNAAIDLLRRELLASGPKDEDTHEALRAESAKILRSLQ